MVRRIPAPPDHNWTEECFPRHSRFPVRREHFQKVSVDEWVAVAAAFNLLAFFIFITLWR